MNYDSYMNPMFSDMDNKYIYPMPYVNPKVYMNPYMMNQMPNQPQQQCGVENQQESYQNPYQGNPMMYMNPYLMNPMMGNMDPNMMMQMMMQMMQMMNCMPGVMPTGCMGMDPSMMSQDMNTNPYNDPMQNMQCMIQALRVEALQERAIHLFLICSEKFHTFWDIQKIQALRDI